MNRNKRGKMPEISRKMYKDVKKYDRQQFTAFCVDLYKYGFEDGRESVPGIDLQEVFRAVSETKGIGEKKMAAIKASIEEVFSKGKGAETKNERED